MSKRTIECGVCEAKFSVISHNSESEEDIVTCPFCSTPIEEETDDVDIDEEYEEDLDDISDYGNSDKYWLDD